MHTLLGIALIGSLALYGATVPGLLLLSEDGQTTLGQVSTIADALRVCQQTNLEGWELVEYAQRLTAAKMSYSRRNPWDSAQRAFERGMGYCQQQASALKLILDGLGIDSRLIYTTKAKFPPKVVHGVLEDEIISGHTWLRVVIDGEERDVCPGNPDNSPGKVHFVVLGKVKTMDPLTKPFAHLGSVVTNVLRDWKSTKFAHSTR